MTIPTAIKRSSTPVSQQQAPVEKKGSSTAQKVDQLLKRNPDAKQAFIFKGAGVKELSTKTPNWFKQTQKGGLDAINGDTRKFFHDLGVESLFHPDPAVREAATFVAQAAGINQAAQVTGATQAAGGSGAFELTPKIRAAVRTLADPSSRAFAQYQQREEKDKFLSETGFGKSLVKRAQDKLKSDYVETPLGTYALDDLARRVDTTTARAEAALVKADEPLVALDESAPAFQSMEDTEWRQRSDDWRKGNVKARPEVNAAVSAYASQTYGGENPFEARSSAGQPVSDLLTYITKGTTEKLAKGGRSTQPLNQFDGRTFGSRTEALHYLLWNTPFMVKVPPAEANRFTKMYKEFADKGL